MEWSGEKINDLIKENNISIIKIAELAGVSRQTVNDWINGQVPKGNHLIFLCKTLNVNPDYLFSQDLNGSVTVPVHRTRKSAKVTPDMQKDALDLAMEYDLLFRNAPEPGILPVMRGKSRSAETAKKVAEDLRIKACLNKDLPPDYKNTFMLMNNLGIKIIFRDFPSKVKAYAFYTKINDHRVVFVNNTTNVLDLIFPLLHEAVHAIRDELSINGGFDEVEEEFCDMVANHVQFPDEYVKMVYDVIKDLDIPIQINKLKTFGVNYNHALFGIIKQIQKINPDFDLKVGGADTNLKKKFDSIGEILYRQNEPREYVDAIKELSPLFTKVILDQIDTLTTRKLGELLGIESILDAKNVKDELIRLKGTLF
jgi:transcriptional regulator with XRE-family HTH domain/Zn-dependent peptidase ImmA (M78 family)